MSEPIDTGAQRVFSPEELDAARAQIAAQEVSVTGAPASSEQQIGQSLIASGAEAAAVDPEQMLAMIRKLQATVDNLQAEKRAATVPEVAKYATAIADHLQVKADTSPAMADNPDATLAPVLALAGQLREAADVAAKTGDPSGIAAPLAAIGAFIRKHGRRNPQVDYSYIEELAEELTDAAAKLAA